MKRNKTIIALVALTAFSFRLYGIFGISLPVIDISRIVSYVAQFEGILEKIQKYSGLFDELSGIDKDYLDLYTKVTKGPGLDFIEEISPEEAIEIRKKIFKAEYFKSLSSDVWNKIADSGKAENVGIEEDYNQFNKNEYYKVNTEYQKRMNEIAVPNAQRFIQDVETKLALVKNQRQLLEKYEKKHEDIKTKLDKAINGSGQQEESQVYLLNVIMLYEEVLQLQDMYSLIRSMLETEINERLTVLNSRNYLTGKRVEETTK